MKPACLPLFAATLLLSSLCPVFAGDPATLLAERGKLLVSEDFSSAVEPARVEPGKPWTAGWRLRPGNWEFNDGVMTGTEVAADKHGAVARFPLKFQDVIIQYEVRLDGCRQTTLSINDQKEHVCRVLVSPSGFTAQKDDHDHEGPDKAEVFGKAAVSVGKGEWKTVVLEIVGEEMVAHIDDQVIAGSHELIGTAKANFGFTVAGDGASFRNLRVWEATPNPAWSKTKAGLAKP